MASIRVELNTAGIRQLLTSDDVLSEVQKRAEAIAAAAGGAPDFEARAAVGPGGALARAMGYAITASMDGRVAEATNRVLTRSVDAGR